MAIPEGIKSKDLQEQKLFLPHLDRLKARLNSV